MAGGAWTPAQFPQQRSSSVGRVLLIVFGSLLLIAVGGCLACRSMIRGYQTDLALSIAHTEIGETPAGLYGEADPALRTQVSPQLLAQVLSAVHTNLGRPKTSHYTSVTRSTVPGVGKTLKMVVLTHFELGDATETILMHDNQGAFNLVGYAVQSPQINVTTGNIP